MLCPNFRLAARQAVLNFKVEAVFTDELATPGSFYVWVWNLVP
jgi:hypothetical protein